MVIHIERTPRQTLDGTTGTVTTGRVTGVIKSIKIYTEANASFNILTTDPILQEYVFGTASPIAVTAGYKIYYPKKLGVLATDGSDLGGTNITNAYCEMAISSPLKINVSAGTTSKTWSVEIVYDG